MTNFQLYIVLMVVAFFMWLGVLPFMRIWARCTGLKLVEITHCDGRTSLHFAEPHYTHMEVKIGCKVFLLLGDFRVFMHPTAVSWKLL